MLVETEEMASMLQLDSFFPVMTMITIRPSFAHQFVAGGIFW
jgi:hypothetical protein